MSIDYIKVKGYKSLKDVHLELKPINILIGANGAGKSNFLSFFEFVNALFHKKLVAHIGLNGGPKKMLFNASVNNELVCRIQYAYNQKMSGAYQANLKLGDDELVFAKEEVISNNQVLQTIQHFKTESQVSRSDIRFLSYYDALSEELPEYLKYHFNNTGKNAPLSQPSHIENDTNYLYEDGRNIAAMLYWLKMQHQKVYKRLVSTIRSVAPSFLNFYLNPNNQGLVKLQWQDQYNSTTYGASDLSDGTLRFIALSLLFENPIVPDLLILDEPELGLHPFALAKLAGMMQGATSAGTQVVVATQSADLVNHFNAEDIITVDMVDGASEFNRLNEEDLSQWLDEYSIGDLWQRSMLKGGQPNAFRG